MVWQQYVYVIAMIIAVAAKASTIGKPPEPLDGSTFAGIIVLQAALIALVVSI